MRPTDPLEIELFVESCKKAGMTPKQIADQLKIIGWNTKQPPCPEHLIRQTYEKPGPLKPVRRAS